MLRFINPSIVTPHGKTFFIRIFRCSAIYLGSQYLKRLYNAHYQLPILISPYKTVVKIVIVYNFGSSPLNSVL